MSKCSLQPLRWRKEFLFLNALPGRTFDATGCILLEVDAPVLSAEDPELKSEQSVSDKPILILDSTWKLLPQLKNSLCGCPIARSLPPGLHSAYPRKSADGSDPSSGLASVEALQVALWLMGKRICVLDEYPWKERFLQQFPPDFPLRNG